MKKFLLQIFFFLLPILLSGYFIDIFISHFLKKSTTHAQREYPTWNSILDGELNSEIFIYGSSRAWVSFDPQIIEESLSSRAFNLGMDGHTISLQYFRHVVALQHNPKPKLIIHSMDHNSLQRGNFYNSDQFLPYMLWDSTFYNSLLTYGDFMYVDYKVPLIRYFKKTDAIRAAFKVILQPGANTPQRIKGYQGQDRSWNEDFSNASKEMQEYIVIPDDSTVALFDRYLSECREQNIKVILVYSPVYIEGQAFIKNQKQIIELYKQFSAKYGLLLLDFSDDEICRDKKYFYNSTHMNKTGSELFTRKLCSQIKGAVN